MIPKVLFQHFRPSNMNGKPCDGLKQKQVLTPIDYTFSSVAINADFNVRNQKSHRSRQNLFKASIKINTICKDVLFHFQIQYLFCDKTGTLTENNMVFKRCTIGGVDFGHNTFTTRFNAATPRASTSTTTTSLSSISQQVGRIQWFFGPAFSAKIFGLEVYLKLTKLNPNLPFPIT